MTNFKLKPKTVCTIYMDTGFCKTSYGEIILVSFHFHD